MIPEGPRPRRVPPGDSVPARDPGTPPLSAARADTTEHSCANGHPSTGPALVAGAWPVVLLRYRPGITGAAARVAHLVPIPPGNQAGSAGVAYCGALLRRDLVETVRPGQGTPCALCVTNCRTTSPPPAPAIALPAGGIAHETDPQKAAGCYHAWGWPVALRGEQVWLKLDPDIVALIIPVSLAAQATRILNRWRCRPLALIHPDVPEHQVMLAGERHSVGPSYPRGVHRITGALPLPPTVVPCGPLSWVRPPRANALCLSGFGGLSGFRGPSGMRSLCGEFDVFAALRTALPYPPA
ncbi:MAG: hypothetical protein JO115_22985 [Pseudonocardiales bacterium]|nr:hypothetical protein [Pseudonocardiales bacterium]